MSDWFDRIAKLAVLGEKFALLADNIGKLQTKVESQESRLVRLETIIEITRPDGTILRIVPNRAGT
jgi:hypothetical protein